MSYIPYERKTIYLIKVRSVLGQTDLTFSNPENIQCLKTIDKMATATARAWIKLNFNGDPRFGFNSQGVTVKISHCNRIRHITHNFLIVVSNVNPK